MTEDGKGETEGEWHVCEIIAGW